MTLQDIARSGILPAEQDVQQFLIPCRVCIEKQPSKQVVWNFQKAMRCVLVVLCFRAGFLHRQKLFDGDAHKWPNLVAELQLAFLVVYKPGALLLLSRQFRFRLQSCCMLSQVFTRLSQELWLLPSDQAWISSITCDFSSVNMTLSKQEVRSFRAANFVQDSGVVYRRYICLALVVLGRAVLGTVWQPRFFLPPLADARRAVLQMLTPGPKCHQVPFPHDQ